MTRPSRQQSSAARDRRGLGVLGGVGGFRVVRLIGLIAFRLNACGFMRILSKGL